ncbi:MAG: WYL domain-containing protein [Candidatus Saccharibacteria bacterium]|nr:WYL domain-containing protein [Candidatus Saccharibacteria bacterium]
MRETIKIKIAIPTTIRNQLELDIDDYELRGIGELCNSIIEFREFLPKVTENKTFSRENNELFKNCPPIQISLHKRNSDFIAAASAKGAKLASLCRHYIEQYISLPRGQREIFLKRVELIKIKSAVESQKNITISYKGKIQKVSPCFIAFSPSQVRAYLVICKNPKDCISAEGTKESPFKALRICHIENVSIDDNEESFHTRTNALFKRSEDLREHFDPFLCYGQELRVKLTKEGVQLYKRASTNRPKILKVPGDSRKNSAESIKTALESETPGIYTLECSPELAKVYFPQFLENAEILSPADLRNYFRQRFLKAANNYGLMDTFASTKGGKTEKNNGRKD